MHIMRKYICLFLYEQNCKPGYVVNDHLSVSTVTNSLKRPTWKRDGQPHSSLFGLASDGVYICPLCYQRGGSLLNCPSTLTTCVAVYFCCTSLGVTSTGRYPASCPMKPGLSSPAPFRLYKRDHSSYSNFYSNTRTIFCKVLFSYFQPTKPR